MQTCAGDGECLHCPEYENEFKKIQITHVSIFVNQ